MAKHNIGPKNGMWKGGRTVTEHGYVLIRVGTKHHLSDSRGYAYEHRLVAESLLGRRLKLFEQIHHKNGARNDNRVSNIEVTAGRAHHAVLHRTKSIGLQLPGEVNQMTICSCGCGTAFLKFDKWGRPRRYISGHNMREWGHENAYAH